MPWLRIYLSLLQVWDRWRLRRQAARHPGLDIHPSASTNLATATFDLAPGAILRIGPEVCTERNPGGLRFHLQAGAQVVIEGGTWLRSELQPLQFTAYGGARIQVGESCILSGCTISAKSAVAIGDGMLLGVGSRIYDADQHPIDADTPERSTPVRIGQDVWVASDATILRGVEIGDHCIVGARSLVTSSMPPHTLAAGNPARKIGEVGDRRAVRVMPPVGG